MRPSRNLLQANVRAVIALAALALSTLAHAQKSPAAAAHAAVWFTSGHTFLDRVGGLTAGDLQAWDAAARKAGVTFTERSLKLVLTEFNALWDGRNKPVPGAVARFAARLTQLPPKIVSEWTVRTGADGLHASASLAAEAELFPHEQFSGEAFRSFSVTFK